MDALHIIAAIFLFILALYWLGTYQFAVIKSFNIPGPTPLPFIGNLLDIKRYGTLDKVLRAYRKLYGNVFHLSLGQETSIVVADPELLKLITVKEFDKFRNRALPVKLPRPMSLGLGVTTDTDWKRIRSTLTPTFSASKMKQMVPIIQGSCDVLMSKYRDAAESGRFVDVNEFSQQYILEVLMSSAFGMEVNTQTEPQKELTETVSKAFANRNSMMWALSSLPFFGVIKKLLSFVFTISASLSNNYLLDVAFKIINQRKQQGFDSSSRKDFVHLMLTTKDKQGNRMLTDEEITAQSVTFLAAGLHTTSTSLTVALCHLAQYPDIQEQLHDEVVEVFHSNPDLPIYDLVLKMEYLDCFFSEVLRMLVRGNALGALTRECTESCTLNGVHFPKGISVLLAFSLVHHDEKYWREPSKFDPERFRGPEKEQRDPNLFNPFGVGPRHCIGMRFAQMEVRMTLTRLVKEFTFKFAPGSKIPDDLIPPNISNIELMVEKRIN